MRPQRRPFLAVLPLALALVACGTATGSPSPSGSAAPPSASPPGSSTPPPASPDPSAPGESGPIGSLDGTGWRVLQVDGVVPEAGKEPTVAFVDGRIVGSTGCNEYGGAVSVDGLTIEVGEVASTLILCEGPVGTMESSFMRALNDAAELVPQGGNLLIRGPGGEILLRPDATVGG